MTSFFEGKKAAAILKHEILKQYAAPFTGKVGKYSQGNRVAFIDGYAGEGQYQDGTEGSPALLMRTAHKLLPTRRLECMFVEKDRDCLEKLRALVAAEGQGVIAEVYEGDVKEHLDVLLERNKGIPLFVFLDPFGLMVPFDDVVKIFKRSGGTGAPATEVLINFNATGLRRIAGHLSSSTPSEATLRRMDDVCGGNWWRKSWIDNANDRQAAEAAVVEGYAKRLSEAATPHYGYWTAEVRNKAHHKPLYYLIFLTRHIEGLVVFGEAVSLGLQEWRRVVNEKETEGTLFAGEDLFEQSEKVLADEWVAEITTNLRRLLSEGKSFVISDRYSEVYGKALGLARQKHLRKAWKELLGEGLTKTDSKGDLVKKRIEPA
ncbi:three-Cys-motif partner protein TcmP [Nonomuraea sp. NPDC050783]|uniref:three-Cys-motif partner protein TcmP n=1 Tax=Nonomuraea sp. NPDC050783 TaxID=3154634 RepID=UPI0034678FB2